VAFITRVNRIRREHRALQLMTNLTFHPSSNPDVLWYMKATPDTDDVLFVAASLDTSRTQEATVEVPIDRLGVGDDDRYGMHELLSDATWEWLGRRNYVKLIPNADPAQIFHFRRRWT
jgi:starch synthase (maltosyl-transferring)